MLYGKSNELKKHAMTDSDEAMASVTLNYGINRSVYDVNEIDLSPNCDMCSGSASKTMTIWHSGHWTMTCGLEQSACSTKD